MVCAALFVGHLEVNDAIVAPGSFPLLFAAANSRRGLKQD
jgi:hypothetical protein